MRFRTAVSCEIAATEKPTHGLQQRRAIAKAAIESTLGHAEVLGQHLNPYALDAGAGEFLEPGFDPALASHLALGVGHGLRLYDS